jgi:RNA polymerase sigma-70 factor (ECF subfamily)
VRNFFGNKDSALRVLSVKQGRNSMFILEQTNLSRDSAQLFTPTPATQEADLVLASRAGNVAAFEELVTRYDRKLLRVAQNIIHNFEDAQDVVQEAFLKAFQKLGDFRGDSKFSTWLFRIVVNQSLMELRKQRTKQRATTGSLVMTDEEDQLPIDFSDWRPNPEAQYETSELRELLANALRGIGPNLRVVFVLHDIEGHSLQETAEALGLSVAAVKTRSLRARLKLRERLSPHFRIEGNQKARTKADQRSASNFWPSSLEIASAAATG